jgi:hypothetical protein
MFGQFYSYETVQFINTVHLCVSYDYHSKCQLFPQTALIRWSVLHPVRYKPALSDPSYKMIIDFILQTQVFIAAHCLQTNALTVPKLQLVI